MVEDEREKEEGRHSVGGGADQRRRRSADCDRSLLPGLGLSRQQDQEGGWPVPRRPEEKKRRR